MTCHLALRRPLPCLIEIRTAEERLPVETSNSCEACGQPIPYPRREAWSTASLCMTCEDTAAHLGHS
jgi:RNA polymerase-binding transcription factor DksA